MNASHRLLVVLDVPTCRAAGHDPLSLVDIALAAGARRFWYRHHGSERGDARTPLVDVLSHVKGAGGHLVASCAPGDAVRIGLDGVHLSSRASSYRSHDGSLTVGRSCHSFVEAEAAALDGADYVTLSPIWSTTSPKTTARVPLGVDAIAELTERCSLPVFALGGIGPERVHACLHRGAAGVAVLGAICMSRSPGNVVKRFIDEISRFSEGSSG